MIKKNPNALWQLDTQLALVDRQIDTLVYQLYALTPEEGHRRWNSDSKNPDQFAKHDQCPQKSVKN